MKKTLLFQNQKENYQKISEKIINFLEKEFKKRNKTKAILAVSGGLDSATCAFLCQKADLDLYIVVLPYQGRGYDGERLTKFLKLPKKRIINLNITSLVDSTAEEIQKIIKLDEVDKGNIMARQRMIIQYALARSLKGLVVGTENLSEYYLGYFTSYGDQACDISPISGFWKTQVYELAKYLGVPQWILKKKPTADLWPGQADEKELGFSYQAADPILDLFIVKKYSKEKIINLGFDKKTVDKVLKRVKITNYKRQGPITLRD